MRILCGGKDDLLRFLWDFLGFWEFDEGYECFWEGGRWCWVNCGIDIKTESSLEMAGNQDLQPNGTLEY